MYGWRKRIGLVVPSGNINTEVEFNRMVPEGVTVHVERVIETAEADEELDASMEAMNKDLVRAAQYLSYSRPDIIVWGCTGATFWKGVGCNRQLEKMIQENVNIPTVTTSTAFLEGFKELGMTRLAVATAYADETNKRLRVFLEGNGLKVEKLKGLGHVGFSCGETTPQEAYRLALDVNTPDADGVFISCTDFPTMDVIEHIERDLRKPVISANQATMWYTLKSVGISDPIENRGSLFRLRR